MSDAYISFTVGVLRCSGVRDYLKSQQFNGRQIRFNESSGWFSRLFEVRGQREDVLVVQEYIESIEGPLAPKKPKFFWSAKEHGFCGWAEDSIEISEELWLSLLAKQSQGMQIVTGVDGLPAAVWPDELRERM